MDEEIIEENYRKIDYPYFNLNNAVITYNGVEYKFGENNWVKIPKPCAGDDPSWWYCIDAVDSDGNPLPEEIRKKFLYIVIHMYKLGSLKYQQEYTEELSKVTAQDLFQKTNTWTNFNGNLKLDAIEFLIHETRKAIRAEKGSSSYYSYGCANDCRGDWLDKIAGFFTV